MVTIQYIRPRYDELNIGHFFGHFQSGDLPTSILSSFPVGVLVAPTVQVGLLPDPVYFESIRDNL